MHSGATFEAHRLQATCSGPRCLRRPTCVGVGVSWSKQEVVLYAWCEEHAAAAMSAIRKASAGEEELLQ
jgi:hypothetical protein